ncbi:MAG TPA: heme o synthase [Usitatibacteraceae bacterium]|nr:heme o synthase [Usitatibacteraceae bacterium]
MRQRVRLFFDLFKLRIGFAIGLTALAGALAVPGATVDAWRVALLVACVIAASASAGAFNQYVERDLDARMGRTRNRAFVTGRLKHGPFWLGVIGLMLALAVCAAAVAVNALAALFVFLGAFFYGVVYTVLLKRRTWMNIVIGGLAGSFAVLAGATGVAPGEIGPVAASLAWVLFLWTPPHFWSLAIAFHDDYRAAGVPMLPVVVGDARAARTVLAGTVVLVASSLLPLAFGLGPVYAVCAVSGGLFFLRAAARLAAQPSRTTAMGSFHASLAQLSLLLIGVIADAAWGG